MVNLLNYKNKKVFITGHTGFKGTWLYIWLKILGANVKGYSLNNCNSVVWYKLNNSLPVEQDVRNYDELYKELIEFEPDIIFHLSAQPLVLESYKNPFETFSINIQGTLNILEISRKLKNLKAIINVVTDKVYDNKEQLLGYKETDQLGGYDPYAVSKVCSELITKCYSDCFLSNNVLVSTCRAGNVIGGGDFSSNRLIPDIIKSKYKSNQSLVIRNPKSIRPFTYVLDVLYGYLLLGAKSLEGRHFFKNAWNFSNNDQTSVLYIVNKMNCQYIIEESEKHETNILLLNSNKAKKYLDWEAKYSIDMCLQETERWYKEYYENNKIITEGQIYNYMDIVNEEIN